jgi:REP element-mobilizing transposase RayT
MALTPLRSPLFFLTFTTYGTWLHGQSSGSVDSRHNVLGMEGVEENSQLLGYRQSQMKHSPLRLTQAARLDVRDTLLEVAAHRGWNILAGNVQPDHVHLLISAEAEPDKTMRDFKSYATRRLREHGLISKTRSVWTEHGSTRWVNFSEPAWKIVAYILNEQADQFAIIDATGEM